ncbi:MAG: hypothetical protein EBU10_06185, partial [Alphaproteobacteria bacterium]|nr:hypothetical protein [Alphaproteobacteria bacterium]
MAKNVVFDEQSAARIAAAVKYVEGLQGGDEEPPIEEVDSTEGRAAIRGQFAGQWAIRTDATVTFVADNGDTGSRTAHNYFATVGAEGETNNCCIIKVGSEWILIAA